MSCDCEDLRYLNYRYNTYVMEYDDTAAAIIEKLLNRSIENCSDHELYDFEKLKLEYRNETIKVLSKEGIEHSLDIQWIKERNKEEQGFSFKEKGCPSCKDCSKDCPAFKEALNRSYNER